ncbi:hypothetical protein COHA_000837 [Chlorella ohadii]|uniref:Uncharacterized protein n=1 Tax=Chlorella ohadii TaxID=2649997 RepID=A0AAD5E0I6_9CHLO|nr:hypothetical protein COHA_000837 [Chlorella ohadii]
MGLHNWAAWNATAAAATSALLADGAGDSPEEFEALLAKAAGPALDSLHKVVCIAYYLPDKRVENREGCGWSCWGLRPVQREMCCPGGLQPSYIACGAVPCSVPWSSHPRGHIGAAFSLKSNFPPVYRTVYRYQAVSPASTDLDRRPPRPRKDSRVRLFRTRAWEAYVAGFSGFATPPRFVYESAKLAHTLIWHQEKFKWGTAILFEYDPPTKSTERWNEVLIPAESWHSLLLDGEELYAEEEEGPQTAQMAAH